MQRYRCQTCRRTFNALTGTALARLRKKDKWLGFSGALVASQPLRQAAATLGVHRNTTLRWRHRFLASLKADRAATLQGITEADETYFLQSHKGCRKLDRLPRRRGGKASKPGLSNEQVCVLVARDRTKQTLDWVTGHGQMSKAQLGSLLQPVLARDVLLVSEKQSDLPLLCAGSPHFSRRPNLSAKTSAGNRDRNKNVFEILMAAVDIYSLRKINNALFEVGGQYHRNM